jgi:recombination protein RecA
MNLIIVDSVAALTPRAELEGNMGDVQPGAQARLMSQAMRKLTAAVGRSSCCIVFLNQIRSKIGVKFGSPETTSGGNALKFFSSLRVKVTRIGDVKDGEVVTGQRDRVKILKNKLSPPYKVCEFDLIFGEGVSLVNECIDIGLEIGALTRSGSWYSYGDVSVLGTRFAALDGQRIGQGRPHAAHNLGQNPELMARIREIALQSLTASSADRVVDDTDQE